MQLDMNFLELSKKLQLNMFDFMWSTCSVEHVGSVLLGKRCVAVYSTAGQCRGSSPVAHIVSMAVLEPAASSCPLHYCCSDAGKAPPPAAGSS